MPAGPPLTMATRSTSARVDDTQTDNAIKLPLLTCMYLGDRWECLFHRSGVGEISLRAYSPHKLGTGEYWLQLPQDKLWVF